MSQALNLESVSAILGKAKPQPPLAQAQAAGAPAVIPAAILNSGLALIKKALAAGAAAFLSFAACSYSQNEVDASPWKWLFVIAALSYSAPTVAEWAIGWCGDRKLDKAKAVGFTLLLEGVMVTSTEDFLRWTALGLLMLINASYAWEMVSRRQAQEKTT